MLRCLPKCHDTHTSEKKVYIGALTIISNQAATHRPKPSDAERAKEGTNGNTVLQTLTKKLKAATVGTILRTCTACNGKSVGQRAGTGIEDQEKKVEFDTGPRFLTNSTAKAKAG